MAKTAKVKGGAAKTGRAATRKAGAESTGKSKRKSKRKPTRGTGAAPATRDNTTAAHDSTAHVTARLYCQGIGDCHLLSFPKPAGGVFRILIDCGIHLSIAGGRELVDKIVDDIVKATEPDHFIDVVVGTHEHWDHNSGFLTAAGKFKQLKVGEVWLGWTENPADPQARRLDKYKGQALAALQDANRRLSHIAPTVADPQRRGNLETLAQGINNILGFNFGLKGEKSRSARDGIVALAPDKVRYLEPTDPPITRPGLPDVRVYVLGPPRDEKLLGITESAAEMYGIATEGWPAAQALAGALAADAGDTEHGVTVTPFEPELGTAFGLAVEKGATDPQANEATEVAFLRNHYLTAADDWRRIDHDWLAIGADLAMQLDDRTNNTSLVLAFEFVSTGRVLLFAADAQVGNWLSWQNVQWPMGDKALKATDLLARTVFYKVGHHGSDNATLKTKGLQLMISKDLSAFIPTNKADALKVKWGQMPFEKLLEDLLHRTDSRVIRADDPWVKDPTRPVPFSLPSGSLHAVRRKDSLWVELEIG
jgi:hypothetical protein